jgi:hypothetical protein
MSYSIVKKPVAEDGNFLYEMHDAKNGNMCVAYCVFSKHPSNQWSDHNVIVSDIYVNHLYSKYESYCKDWLLGIVIEDVYAEGFTHIIIPCDKDIKTIKYNIRNMLAQVNGDVRSY